jgi:hypothetical protein
MYILNTRSLSFYKYRSTKFCEDQGTDQGTEEITLLPSLNIVTLPSMCLVSYFFNR